MNKVVPVWVLLLCLLFGALFTSTMKLAGLLVAIGAVAAVFILVSSYSGIMIGDFLASWPGILFILVVATTYYTARKLLA